jgi:Pvc16 N-terminal domain
MIVEAATLILVGLNQFMRAADASPVGSTDITILGTPAQIDNAETGPGLENQVLLTLVNLEEEAALKNGHTAFAEFGGVLVRHRPVHLNLLLVFSANFANYQTAITRLDQVVTYFQNTKRFEPALFPGALPGLPPETDLSVTMELVSLSLEEMNHVWGVLGGRQLPFATYRARLVVLREDRPAAGAGEIRDVRVRMRDTVTAMEGA